MQFTEVTDEELGQLQFANGGRSRNGKSPYDDLLKAVKGGKRVKALLEGKMQIKNLKWGLSQAAKKAGMKVIMQVLADNSGVVVSYDGEIEPAATETGETTAEAPATGTRPRK